LLSFYCKHKGNAVLKELLTPFFEEVIAKGRAIEVDPNRIEEEQAKENVKELSTLVNRLLERVYFFVDKFPS